MGELTLEGPLGYGRWNQLQPGWFLNLPLWNLKAFVLYHWERVRRVAAADRDLRGRGQVDGLEQFVLLLEQIQQRVVRQTSRACRPLVTIVRGVIKARRPINTNVRFGRVGTVCE
uniref:(northern house mosquito) hypothetical protein n=1 Tax=Culex pipiens TaxID=7175 RepID=A0A8D8F591_CULPI